MDGYFSFWDYTLIVGYFIGCAALGLYFKRQATKNLDEYYLGGRRMPWWLLGFAGMSSWFDITGTMVITSFIYMMGPRGLFVELRGGTGMMLAFMMIMMGKWHRRSGVMTKGEWMIYRFGKGSGGEAARVLTAIGFMLLIIGLMGYLIRGTGLFLSTFLPMTPSMCSLMVLAICTLYTALSGFYGVVYTDFLQSILILAGAIIIAVLAFLRVPDVQSLAAVAQQVTNQAEWASSVPRWHVDMPAGYEAYSPLIFIAAFYFMRNFLGGLDSGADAKYFGARDDRECGLLSYLWNWLIMLRWPMIMGFAVLGIYLVHNQFANMALVAQATDLIKQHYPEVTKNIWHDQLTLIAKSGPGIPTALTEGLQQLFGDAWRTKLTLIGFDGGIDPEQILPAVMLYALPRGLRGFIFVVMLAAGMSTFTTFVNGAGPYFVRDIYQRFLRKRASNRELIYTSYLTTLIIMLAGYWLAYQATSINDIWGWLMMSLTIATGFAGLLRFYWWRLNGEGVAYGTVIGLLVTALQRWLAPQMPEWQQFSMVLLATVGGSVVASLLTRPTEVEVLRHFYRSTRPFGFWGKFKAELPKDEQLQISRENRNDLIALPIAIVWQHVLYLLLMQLVMRHWMAFLALLPLFIVCQIALHRIWFRNLSSTSGVVAENPVCERPELAKIG